VTILASELCELLQQSASSERELNVVTGTAAGISSISTPPSTSCSVHEDASGCRSTGEPISHLKDSNISEV